MVRSLGTEKSMREEKTNRELFRGDPRYKSLCIPRDARVCQ